MQKTKIFSPGSYENMETGFTHTYTHMEGAWSEIISYTLVSKYNFNSRSSDARLIQTHILRSADKPEHCLPAMQTVHAHSNTPGQVGPRATLRGEGREDHGNII